MQTIHLTLQDPLLEQAVQRLTAQRQQNVQELVVAALRHYIKEIEQPLKIPKLDPFQHSQTPARPFQAISPEDATRVFHDVENSAEFGKQLRQQAWRDE
jgi:hypothetical protein